MKNIQYVKFRRS